MDIKRRLWDEGNFEAYMDLLLFFKLCRHLDLMRINVCIFVHMLEPGQLRIFVCTLKRCKMLLRSTQRWKLHSLRVMSLSSL